MDAFKEFVSSSNSMVAAYAMVRTLLARKTLHSDIELGAYLRAVCNHRSDAKTIAQNGLAIIAKQHAAPIWKLDDDQAELYVDWLSHFVVERANAHAPDPDRGRTLLTELRKLNDTH